MHYLYKPFNTGQYRFTNNNILQYRTNITVGQPTTHGRLFVSNSVKTALINITYINT